MKKQYTIYRHSYEDNCDFLDSSFDTLVELRVRKSEIEAEILTDGFTAPITYCHDEVAGYDVEYLNEAPDYDGSRQESSRSCF